MKWDLVLFEILHRHKKKIHYAVKVSGIYIYVRESMVSILFVTSTIN